MAWKGLEGQGKPATRPGRASQWPEKPSKARKFGKERVKMEKNVKCKHEVPKFGMRILRASHFGARNECFQTAKMC